jgi:hypothetical protein
LSRSAPTCGMYGRVRSTGYDPVEWPRVERLAGIRPGYVEGGREVAVPPSYALAPPLPDQNHLPVAQEMNR